MSTDDLELLNQRIEERSRRGEHYVLPKIVEDRYLTSLKLLDHYFDIPDKISLIDNSKVGALVLEKSGDTIERVSTFPEWVEKYLSSHLNNKKVKVFQAKDLPTKEDVLKMYRDSMKK